MAKRTNTALWVILGVTGGLMAMGAAGVVGVVILVANYQPYGKAVPLNGGSQLYHTKDVSPDEAAKAAKFLNANLTKGGGNKIDLQLTKGNGVPQLKAVIMEGKLQEAELPFLALGYLMSAEVYGGGAMEVHLCDDHLKTLKVLTVKGKSETPTARK